MSTNFPGSLDNGTTLPNPSTTSYEDTLSHAAQHANANDAVKAVQTKLGTSASTPSSGLILLGTGAGSSSWSQLTSAQLFALLADKTGSSSAVFNTSPTLITPKVDTINEATLNNGVTVGGVNMKSGVIQTANSVANGAVASGIQSSKLSNPYKFRVYRNAAASVASTVTAKIQFDTKTYDTSSNFDTTNFRFTAPVAGFYYLTARTLASAASMNVQLMLYKNGVLFSRGTNTIGDFPGLIVTDTVSLAANDYVEVFLVNSSAGNAPLGVGADNTYFSGFLVSTT